MKLYSLDGCPVCDYVKSALLRKQIPYTVSQDRKEMAEKGVSHCPALETDDGNLLSGKALIQYINSL